MRRKSQTKLAEKIVNTEKYRQITYIKAKKQKLFNAVSEVYAPNMNASALVNDVIVIDGPA